MFQVGKYLAIWFGGSTIITQLYNSSLFKKGAVIRHLKPRATALKFKRTVSTPQCRYRNLSATRCCGSISGPAGRSPYPQGINL